MTVPETPPTDLPRAERGAEPRRGWKKLILALLAFVLVPAIPQVRAIVPIDETMLLFVPAMAACALIGWWAGGRVFPAILWVLLAIMLGRQVASPNPVYSNLLRGWTLLLAGSFGLVCLVGGSRPFFAKAIGAVGVSFALALLMAAFGPVSNSSASAAIAGEFARRNTESLAMLDTAISANRAQWQDMTVKFPALVDLQSKAADHLTQWSRAGRVVFPALLALQSLAALALAWATYHRLSRQRLGSPLAPLREFRFNDQFVWGLIVGLVILLMPNLAGIRAVGGNLVLFFGTLYALRGLGVLAWFMAPGAFAISLVVGFVMLFAPLLQVFAVLGFLTLGITALGLGVGDTWADWRNRARSTLS